MKSSRSTNAKLIITNRLNRPTWTKLHHNAAEQRDQFVQEINHFTAKLRRRRNKNKTSTAAPMALH